MTAPPHPQQHCGHEQVCAVFIAGSRIAYADGTRCMSNQKGCKECPHDTRLTANHLIITNTLTGEQYTDVYDPHLNGLQQLCIDAGLSGRLTYCDIECLLTDGETWYMLDECGNWAYLPPSVYKVEVVR